MRGAQLLDACLSSARGTLTLQLVQATEEVSDTLRGDGRIAAADVAVGTSRRRHADP